MPKYYENVKNIFKQKQEIKNNIYKGHEMFRVFEKDKKIILRQKYNRIEQIYENEDGNVQFDTEMVELIIEYIQIWYKRVNKLRDIDYLPFFNKIKYVEQKFYDYLQINEFNTKRKTDNYEKPSFPLLY